MAKLYQVQVQLRSLQPFATYIFSSESEARKCFNRVRREPLTLLARLHRLELRTDLKLQDWISLLESDSPGLTMTMTVRDLITEQELLLEWSRNLEDA